MIGSILTSGSRESLLRALREERDAKKARIAAAKQQLALQREIMANAMTGIRLVEEDLMASRRAKAEIDRLIDGLKAAKAVEEVLQ